LGHIDRSSGQLLFNCSWSVSPSAIVSGYNSRVETFRLVGEIEVSTTIAEGSSVRDSARLNKTYGLGQWRKRKGYGLVELRNGAIRRVELHWYDAHGIGRRDLKIKRYVD